MTAPTLTVDELAEWVTAAKDRRRVVVARPDRPAILGTLTFAGRDGGKCRVLVPGAPHPLTFPRRWLRLVES